MELLSLVVSVTSRRAIISKYLTETASLPALAFGDTLDGRITCVAETYDPTEPTVGVSVTGSTKIALTDGATVLYAQASGIAVQNSNELVFTLVVTGTALLAAFGTALFADAYLEIRATINGKDELIAKEPITILRAATTPL